MKEWQKHISLNPNGSLSMGHAEPRPTITEDIVQWIIEVSTQFHYFNLQLQQVRNDHKNSQLKIAPLSVTEYKKVAPWTI